MRTKNWILASAAALLVAGCSGGPAGSPATASASPQSAQEALRPYYATLQSKLPVAAPNPALASDTVLTRIAFGSCQNENRSMAFWDVIAAQKPQAFLLIGDNVYGDTGATGAADIPTLSASCCCVMPTIQRRWRMRLPTWASTGCFISKVSYGYCPRY